MPATAAEIIAALETLAPPRYAGEGDPIGLQAGRRDRRVRTVLLALDATVPVLEEAARRGAQMVVTHHPAFYKGLRRLDEEECKGALAAAALRREVVLYAAHTNLDVAPGGAADCLADAAGLDREERAPLVVTGQDRFLKLTVFVPASHLDAVRRAVCRAGAGRYGEYSDCTFRTAGTGAFRPSAAARPHTGRPGRYEEVEEWRLESRVLAPDRAAVETALLDSHPYEVPAYDFAPLEAGRPYGLGRVGERDRAIRLDRLAARLAETLKAPGVQLCGRPARRVRRLAVWSGAGAPLPEAAAAGAACLVTGECSYHDAETAAHLGVAVLRLGHGASERPALKALAARLRPRVKGVRILLSRERNTPFRNC